MTETKNIILDIDDAEAYENLDFEDFNNALNGVYFKEKAKTQLEHYKSLVDDFCNESKGADVEQLSQQCCEVIINTVLGPFGISPALFNDKLGGNVTTQHNASQGIFAKEKEQFDRKPYTSTEYNRTVKEKKSESNIISGYTGKPLDVSEADADHIISCHEIHKDFGYMLTKEERDKVGGEKDNITLVEKSANRSKGDNPLKDWENSTSSDGKQKNKEKYGIDDRRANAKQKQAEIAIEKHRPSTAKVVKYHATELAKQGAKDAGKNALRKAIGLLLGEISVFLIDVIRDSIKAYKESKSEDIKVFLNKLKEILKNRTEEFKENNLNSDKFKQILKELGTSAGSGALSTLVTYIVNCFFTTATKVVTMIRENINSFIQAIKIMADKNIPMEQRVVAASKVVFDAILATLGIVLVQALTSQLKTLPFLADISESVANVIVGLLTGLISVVAFYFVNKFINSVNETHRAMTATYASVALNVVEAHDCAVDVANLVETSCELNRHINDLNEEHLKYNADYEVLSNEKENIKNRLARLKNRMEEYTDEQ